MSKIMMLATVAVTAAVMCAQAPAQNANDCAAAHQRQILLAKQLNALMAAKQHAATGRQPHAGPPHRISPDDPPPQPDPDEAANLEQQIQAWHRAHDAEMLKLTALLSSGNCLPIWQSDDGAYYFTRRDGDDFWWVGMSNDSNLQRGLSVCNVFRGKISGDKIQGEWADVPRARWNNAGSLSLSFKRDAYGYLRSIQDDTAGPFSVKAWHPADLPPGPPAVSDAFAKTFKGDDDHSTLADNLHLLKDPVVVTGTLANTVDCNFVIDPVNHPATFKNFWAKTNDDKDMTFNLMFEPAQLPANFTAGITSADDLQNLKSRIAAGLHCEMIMFGRDAEGKTTYLPGWAETGGNSILVNGAPINANVTMDPAPWLNTNFVTAFNGTSIVSGCYAEKVKLSKLLKPLVDLTRRLSLAKGIRPPGDRPHIPTRIDPDQPPTPATPPDPTLVKSIEAQIAAWHKKNDKEFADISADLAKYPCTITLRVTGALCFDVGHGEASEENIILDALFLGLAFLNPVDHPINDLVEIHPVYSIDVVNGMPSDNVSGVWGSDDGATIYLHQVDAVIWGVWTRPYGDRTYTRALRCDRAANSMKGDWIDVPGGSEIDKGTVTLDLSADKLHLAANLAARGSQTWTKLR